MLHTTRQPNYLLGKDVVEKNGWQHHFRLPLRVREEIEVDKLTISNKLMCREFHQIYWYVCLWGHIYRGFVFEWAIPAQPLGRQQDLLTDPTHIARSLSLSASENPRQLPPPTSKSSPTKRRCVIRMYLKLFVECAFCFCSPFVRIRLLQIVPR